MGILNIRVPDQRKKGLDFECPGLNYRASLLKSFRVHPARESTSLPLKIAFDTKYFCFLNSWDWIEGNSSLSREMVCLIWDYKYPTDFLILFSLRRSLPIDIVSGSSDILRSGSLIVIVGRFLIRNRRLESFRFPKEAFRGTDSGGG